MVLNFTYEEDGIAIVSNNRGVCVCVCVAAARGLLRQRHRSDSRRSHARPRVVRPAVLHGSTCSALPYESGGWLRGVSTRPRFQVKQTRSSFNRSLLSCPRPAFNVTNQGHIHTRNDSCPRVYIYIYIYIYIYGEKISWTDHVSNEEVLLRSQGTDEWISYLKWENGS